MKKKNKSYALGLCIVLCVIAFILLGTLWKPYDPNAMHAAEKMLAPSTVHLLGTDQFGRDVFSRLLEGTRETFLIAAVTVSIGMLIGLLIGSITGYFGGIMDEILMRLCDTITAFPSILLALVCISLMGPGKYNVIAALSILFIPSFARIVRTEFSRLRHAEFVHSARIMGVSHVRIMFVHILPNLRAVLFSSLAIGFNNAVLAEASMSFLGIGVQPPDASLGRMLAEAQAFFLSAPWYACSVGITIILMILGFSLLGDEMGAGFRLQLPRMGGEKYAPHKGLKN